jgi:hypothetical protein
MGFSKPQKTLQHININQNNQLKNKQQLTTKNSTTLKTIEIEPTDEHEKLHVEQQTTLVQQKMLQSDDEITLHDEISLEDEIEIDETKSTCVANRYFCYYCQIQFKTPQEINQHKKTQKHQKNVQGSLTKFNVGDDIITNKDYDLLISEKGWLSDSVSFSD